MLRAIFYSTEARGHVAKIISTLLAKALIEATAPQPS